MPLPVTFATLPTGNNPASLLDQNFNAVAAMGTTYCTATGTNAILLTAAPNQAGINSYANGQRYSFIAAANNTGACTMQLGALAAIPLRSGGLALGAGALLAGTPVDVIISGNGTTADVVGGGGSGYLIINKTATAGMENDIVGQTNGAARWDVVLGNAVMETGTGNAGSDFVINRFNDAGTLIDSPIQIQRSTGIVTVSQTTGTGFNIASQAGTALLNLVKQPGAFVNAIQGYRGANLRWAMYLGNTTAEPGSANAGSDFVIQRASDAGTAIDTPMFIARTSAVTTFSVAIVNGPSDRTLKENITPLENSLDKVKALQGVAFNFKATPEKREIGLIAQDVEPVIPEVIQQFQLGPDAEGKEQEPKLALDYPKLVALLIEAIKTLTARVEALEAR